MPEFKSEEDAVKAHVNYHYDTDHEGKFTDRHTGWLRTKQLVDWIPDNEPIFLGIGCNSGGLERTIIRFRPGSIAYGIDVNPNMVKIAQQKGIIAQVARGENLPFPIDFFDVVILSEVLEHLYNPQVVLSECLRVLKSGGLIIGSVPHSKGINAAKGTEHHLYHTRIYNHNTLKKCFKRLKDFEIKDIPFKHYIEGYDVDLDITKKIPQWMAFKGIK